jgi:hypothetical protein
MAPIFRGHVNCVQTTSSEGHTALSFVIKTVSAMPILPGHRSCANKHKGIGKDAAKSFPAQNLFVIFVSAACSHHTSILCQLFFLLFYTSSVIMQSEAEVVDNISFRSYQLPTPSWARSSDVGTAAMQAFGVRSR